VRLLKNSTDIPDETVREIIAFVRPRGLPTSKFDVMVTNCSGIFTGKCYTDGYYSSDRPHIILRVTKNEKKFPYLSKYTPTKFVKLYWEQLNEKTGEYEEWHGGVHRPNPNGSTGGYIDSLTLSREEALVHIAAHELRHLWQKNHIGKRGKVRGARGRYSDTDADAYAIRKKKQWRRMKYGNTDALELSALLWRQYDKPSLIGTDGIPNVTNKDRFVLERNAAESSDPESEEEYELSMVSENEDFYPDEIRGHYSRYFEDMALILPSQYLELDVDSYVDCNGEG